MLTYLPPLNAISSQRRTLVWVDREGRSEPLTAEPRGFYVVELSPDGTKVALDVTGLNRDVWTYDLSRDTMTRLTLDPGDDTYPVWTPDGRRLIMGSSRDGGPRKLYVCSADGTGPIEPLSTNENHRVPMAVSPDGHALVFTESGDLGILSLTGGGESRFLLETQSQEFNVAISNDGRWMVYQSDESAKFEVLVRPFPNVNDGRWQISSGGGRWPRWSRDGAEFFYWSDDTLVAVAVETEPTFRPASPSPLFDYPGIYRNVGRPYDVAPDAQRFLLVDTSADADGVPSTSTHIRVVLNWVEELKARVPIEK